MATAMILAEEMRLRLLPPLCLRCGRPAADWVSAEMRCTPRWVWAFLLLPPVGLVLLVVLTRRTTIAVPMCRRHMLHWAKLVLLQMAILVGIFAGPMSLIALSRQFPGPVGNPNFDLLTLAAIGWGMGMFAIIVAYAVLRAFSIRSREIDRGDVLLVGVSDRFASALEAVRREPSLLPPAQARIGIRGTRLDRDAARLGRLPPICMCCGAAAVGQISLLFKWRPPAAEEHYGTRVPPRVAEVWAPVCGPHGEHWTRMRWYRLGFFAAAIGVTVGLWFAAGYDNWLREQPLAPFGRGPTVGLLLWLGAMLLWFVADRIAKRFPIRVTEINGPTITLEGIAPAFATALRDWQAPPAVEPTGARPPDERVRGEDR